MNWSLIIVVIVLFFIFFIFFLKVTVIIDILHTKNNDCINITWKALFGLLSYTYNVPVIDVDPDSHSLLVKSEKKVGQQKTLSKKKEKITPLEFLQQLKQAKQFLNHVIHFHVIIQKFFRHVTIHKWQWHSVIGFDDAAHTGIASGVLWSMKGSIVGIISRYVKLKDEPNLVIIPNFQEQGIDTKCLCIISFRIGHAIVGAFTIMKYWKSNKGGNQHVRSSHSRLNDDSDGKFKRND